MSCLNGSEIQRYVLGTLGDTQADEAKHHLVTCKRCRQAVAKLRGQSDSSETPSIHATKQYQKSMLMVECEVCKTRYSIPAKRVQGRILKIRCKNCSNIIHIDGSEKRSASIIERGKKLWFIVVSRERVGPMTEQEIRDRFKRKEISVKTYAWRRGFEKWVRLRDINEFRDLSEENNLQPLDPTRSVQTQAVNSEFDSTKKAPHRSYSPPADESERLRFNFQNEKIGLQPDRLSDSGPSPAYQEPQLDDFMLNKSNGFDSETPTEFRTTEDMLDEQKTNIHFRQSESNEHENEDSHDIFNEQPAKKQPTDRGVSAESPSSINQEALKNWDQAFDGSQNHRPPVNNEILSPTQWERNMKGQRREDSVLFSLNYLQNLAGVDNKEESSASGNTGLFQIKATAGPSVASLLLPQEEKPKKQRSFMAFLGVAFLGVLLGVGVLTGILYMVQPMLVEAIISGKPINIGTNNQQLSKASHGGKDKPQKPVLVVETITSSIKSGGLLESKAIASVDGGVGPKNDSTYEKSKVSLNTSEIPDAMTKASMVKRKQKKRRRRRKRKRWSDNSIETEDLSHEGKIDKEGPKPEHPAVEPPKAELPKATKRPEIARKKEIKPTELDKLIDAATKNDPLTEEEKKKVEPGEEGTPVKKGVADKSTLPKTLSRTQVAKGMKLANPGIKACYYQFNKAGLVVVKATIKGSTGKISAIKVIGDFANTPVGTCVLSAIRSRCSFPNFSGPPLTLKYPYMLR